MSGVEQPAADAPSAGRDLDATPPGAASPETPTDSRRRTRRRGTGRTGRIPDPPPPDSPAEDDQPGPPTRRRTRDRSGGHSSTAAASGTAEDTSTEQPQLPPLHLRDGLPALTTTPDALAAAVAALAAGSGPLAIDTERASGYRYGQRAYLIQIRREGSGTFLIDPIAVPGVPGLKEALTGPEWILHAATQDLPCLAELDLYPSSLFDTELAGRLLGLPRVGLGPMVADLLQHSLAKGHGAADWSKRPLPQDWLEYAALDVEVLLELRTELRDRLETTGKLDWALEEFEGIRTAPAPEPPVDRWRRTSGMHQIKQRRGLAIVQQLWEARDAVAQRVDVAPGRLVPDSSIIAAAQAQVRDGGALRALRTFHGRGASRYQREWAAALEAAWAIPENQLPKPAGKTPGPPQARMWAQRDAVAAGRLERARTALGQRAEELGLPVENLLTPELVRRLMWDPKAVVGDPATSAEVGEFLAAVGARPWQIAQTADLLAAAIPTPPPTESQPSAS